MDAAFNGIDINAHVYRNKSFDAHARTRESYDPILCSPLTAEIDADDDPLAHAESFQIGVVRLIQALRSRAYIVTASCDFEDRVRADTGWNWSTQTTEPPGRVRR